MRNHPDDASQAAPRRKENADPTEAIARHRIAALPVTAERAGGVPARDAPPEAPFLLLAGRLTN